MLHLPNTLLIVGTDRNAGKTTFASRIIRHISGSHPVNALKISPHFHELKESEDVILHRENFIIAREHEPEGTKDSNRFLKAGAKEVYYMQVWDENLLSAFEALLEIAGSRIPMVIESGWLRNVVEPGKFVIVNRKDNLNHKDSINKYKQFPHTWTEFDGENFDPAPDRILWTGTEWK